MKLIKEFNVPKVDPSSVRNEYLRANLSLEEFHSYGEKLASNHMIAKKLMYIVENQEQYKKSITQEQDIDVKAEAFPGSDTRGYEAKVITINDKDTDINGAIRFETHNNIIFTINYTSVDGFKLSLIHWNKRFSGDKVEVFSYFNSKSGQLHSLKQTYADTQSFNEDTITGLKANHKVVDIADKFLKRDATFAVESMRGKNAKFLRSYIDEVGYDYARDPEPDKEITKEEFNKAIELAQSRSTFTQLLQFPKNVYIAKKQVKKFQAERDMEWGSK